LLPVIHTDLHTQSTGLYHLLASCYNVANESLSAFLARAAQHPETPP
jgi:hypothetical protein